MEQLKAVITGITNLLFGYKYYAAVLNTRGVIRTELSSKIFRSRHEAEEYRRSMETNMTFSILEIVSFRSRKDWYEAPKDRPLC